MKIRTICTLATIVALAAAIGVPSAAAQSITLKAEVPFEFYAAGKLFPPGTYMLSKLNPEVLKLRDSRGVSVFIPAGREAAKMEDRNWVVFHQYGEVSFLAGAYWSGSGVSLKAPASRAELEIARKGGEQRPVTLATK